MILTPPAALVVAHPGHELRLFRWLELDRPTVFVLTDGSGHSGRSRLPSTRAVLAAVGCQAGSIIGPLTDAAVYRAIIDGDVTKISAITLELADEIARAGFRSVVSDAVERYNPTHDLCWFMANLAALRASRSTGRPIDRFSYAVVGHAGAGITITLDDEVFQRKMETARGYEDLADDVAELTARLGADGLRREVFTPTPAGAPVPEPLARKPYFESRGEEQVATGKYETVLRYDEHFVPFVRKLIATVA